MTLQPATRYIVDQHPCTTADPFLIPPTTNIKTKPLILSAALNHATAIKEVEIMTATALTGTATLTLALIEDRDLCTPVILLDNLAAAPLAVPAAATTVRFELGKHWNLAIGIILNKAPHELMTGFRLAIVGNAATTNTAAVSMMVSVTTVQVPAQRFGALTADGSTVVAATN